jgi:hypothetical protein
MLLKVVTMKIKAGGAKERLDWQQLTCRAERGISKTTMRYSTQHKIK